MRTEFGWPRQVLWLFPVTCLCPEESPALMWPMEALSLTPLPRLHPHGARHPHVRRRGPVGPGHVLLVLLWHLCRGVPALSLRDCLLRIPGELPKLLRKPVGSFRISDRPGVTLRLFLAGEVAVAVREGPGHNHRT